MSAEPDTANSSQPDDDLDSVFTKLMTDIHATKSDGLLTEFLMEKHGFLRLEL